MIIIILQKGPDRGKIGLVYLVGESMYPIEAGSLHRSRYVRVPVPAKLRSYYTAAVARIQGARSVLNSYGIVLERFHFTSLGRSPHPLLS